MKDYMIKEVELNKQNATYEFIGRLALALFSQNIHITFTALRQILADNSLKIYNTNRGMARGVASAYKYWEKQERKRKISSTCAAIADTFVDQYIHRAWDK